ncbi:MAG: hypothetical protein CEN90_69 [Parcubacteria group bacterium Licking1014_17]|nr:MAG: hypothetical protein CEN90_69 [Parcubacteria group bacterium Licking1014_17]
MGVGLFHKRNRNKNKSAKTAKQMERHFKGIANHRRIEVLLLIDKHGGISVEEIAESVACNFKTISEHVRRLAQAGLVEKKYKGRLVTHTLSPYGKIFTEFILTFSHS